MSASQPQDTLIDLDNLTGASYKTIKRPANDEEGDEELSDLDVKPLIDDDSSSKSAPENGDEKPKSKELTDEEKRQQREQSATLKQLNVWRLLALAKPEALKIALALVALLISSGTFLVVPKLFGNIIDVVLSPDTPQEEAQTNLRWVIFSLFFFFLLSSLFTFIRAALFTIAGESIVAGLRKRLYAAVVSQEIGFFDTNRTGELMNRLASDCSVLQSTVTANISMGLRFSLQAIIGLVILFFISWKLTLLMIVILPLIAGASILYGRYVKTISKQVQQRLAEASNVAEESLASMRTVRAFSAEDYEQSRYGEKVGASFEAAKKRAIAEGFFTAGTTLIADFAVSGVLWLGGSLVISGEMTAGTLTSFILYTITVGASFGAISGLYGDLMKAVGASERVFELLDRKPAIRFAGGLPVAHENEFIVKFDNVHFNYPSRPEHPVLEGINLELRPGKVVALVGPSGSGKSTIAHLIERFYEPSAGSITVDDTDLALLDPKMIRKNIAIVSQGPTLFAQSIEDNIAYGSEEEDFSSPQEKQQRIIAAAKMANAHEFISKFPEGYKTMVGERGVRLSGGQVQRVAIARALLRDPKILLLDEATSALDAESEYLVKQALDELLQRSRKTYTVLVIAHRLSTVRTADEVDVVLNGKIVEKGTHDELVKREGVYKRLVTRQLSND